MHLLQITLFLLFLSNTYAAILGDISEVRHSPGYIETSVDSEFYKGVHTSSEVKGGANRKTPSQILLSFTTNNNIDVLKIQSFIHQLMDTQTNIQTSFCIKEFRKKINDYHVCLKPNSIKGFDKKWSKSKFKITLDFAINELEKAKELSQNVQLENINNIESQVFLEKLFFAVEVFEGIRAEDEQLGLYSKKLLSVTQFRDILFGVNTIKADRIHAANLLRVEKDHPRLFYSRKELQELEKNGVDISKLDPPSTGLWRKPKKSIQDFDTSNYDHQNMQQLKKLLPKHNIDDFINPNQVIDVLYTGSSLPGGTTPKFNVFIGDSKWKLKFITDKHASAVNLSNPLSEIYKYAQGSEVNTEPVVNNLAAALGFTVDPTYFKRKVRVYLEGNNQNRKEFLKKLSKLTTSLSERYPGRQNTGSAFKNIKQDQNGQFYVEMKSVTLESKSNVLSDMNIGFFTRDGLGKSLMREHRGFYTFLAWIADPDVKNDNTKVKIVPYTDKNQQTRYKYMLSASDMGAALGVGVPNLYNKKLIEYSDAKTIKYNYLRTYPFPLSKAVNIDDAKWMARRISQLSKNQIYKAFLSGGYPEVVCEYYTLLMLRKRNELLVALKMIGEEFIDDGGQRHRIELKEEFSGTIPGYEQFFRNQYLTDPNNDLRRDDYEDWDRNWGVAWGNYDTESAQKAVLKSFKIASLKLGSQILFNRLLEGITLSNNGIRTIPIKLTSARTSCSGSCFVQGVDVGPSNFVPFRTIVRNDNNNEKPYLVVDTFRVGVNITANTHLLEDVLGFDIPSVSQLRGGLRFFRLVEFMKVHPTDDIQDYLNNPSSLLKLSKTAILNNKKRLIDSLAKGDSLIINHYLGSHSGLRYDPGIVLPFASTRIGLANIKLSRMTLLKNSDDSFQVYWGQGKNKQFHYSLGIKAPKIDIPFVKYVHKRVKNEEYSYTYNLSKDNEENLFYKHIERSYPPEASNSLRTHHRYQDLKEKKSLLNFIGLRGAKKKQRTHSSEFKDYIKDETHEKKVFEIVTEKTIHVDIDQMRQKSTRKVEISSSNDLIMSYNYHATHPALERSEFQRLIKKIKNILPEDIIPFEFKAIKTLMGKVTIDVNIDFNKKALLQFLDPSINKIDLCQQYAKFKGQKDPSLSCYYITDDQHKAERKFKIQFNKLWRRYIKARKALLSIKDDQILETKRKKLKRILKIIKDKSYRLHTLEFMLQSIGKKNFRRDVLLKSSLAAFPGDTETIKESKLGKGKLDRLKKEELQLFSDRLHELIKPYFFDERILNKL